MEDAMSPVLAGDVPANLAGDLPAALADAGATASGFELGACRTAALYGMSGSALTVLVCATSATAD